MVTIEYKFKVGQLVTVKNWGKAYSCYDDWFFENNVNYEQTKSHKLPETTIDIKDLDELIQLVNSLNGREIIIYKDYYYDDMNNKVYDDKYTIEIYDDWRE